MTKSAAPVEIEVVPQGCINAIDAALDHQQVKIGEDKLWSSFAGVLSADGTVSDAPTSGEVDKLTCCSNISTPSPTSSW